MKTALNILNLEDNLDDAALNEAMISARWPQCKLVRVDTREDFVSALERGGFDLILSDYTMPGFNGLQALDLARAKRPEVPFMFVSGTIGEDTAIEALKKGATDYVLKHRLMRLIPAVDRAIQQAEERAECERAEDAMRQSEHKYRELFECLGEAAFLVDEQSGKIIDVNRRAEAVIGCTRTDVLGRNENRFLKMDNSRAGSSDADRHTIISECELIRADGVTVPMELRATRLKLYGNWLVLRLAHSLDGGSDSGQTEELRARLAAIVQSSDDGIIGKTLEGTITSWNPGAQRLFGYTEQEVIGKSVRMLIPPDRQGEEGTILARIGRGERVENFETVRIKKDGTAIDVSVTISPIMDAQGKIIGASKIVRDITDRKRSADLVNASLKEIVDLKAALDEHAIVAITDPQGKITYVNDKFCAISKYSRNELLGQDHRIINSGYHPKEFIRNLWTTIARGKVWHGEIKNKAKDGTFYWVDTTIVPFLNAEGKPRQYVAIRADITERKHAEAEILQLNTELEGRVAKRTAELEAANKELESFSYSISHDLRAPLRAVNGFADIVLEEFGSQLPEQGRKYLERIRNGGQQMGKLIDDLLTFSRLNRQPVTRGPVDTATLVQEAREGLASQQGNRQIEWRVGNLPACNGDPVLLKQVWINLLSNAIKYTRGREPAIIEIGCENWGGEKIFFVRDNGVGFDMQYADKLFGVFQRLHRADEFEGTGVGLAIVERIVRRHGGRVWAQASLGKGATFYFTMEGEPRDGS